MPHGSDYISFFGSADPTNVRPTLQVLRLRACVLSANAPCPALQSHVRVAWSLLLLCIVLLYACSCRFCTVRALVPHLHLSPRPPSAHQPPSSPPKRPPLH
jgi:hypothetical protein